MDNKNTRPQNSIFSRESPDLIETPDQLNDYVRVATPRTWFIAIAILLVLASLTIWGLVGKIPQYTQSRGVGVWDGIMEDVSDEEGNLDYSLFRIVHVLGFVNSTLVNPHQLNEKDVQVIFDDGTQVHGTSSIADAAPYNSEEISYLLDAYAVSTPWVNSHLGLDEAEYWYRVDITLDKELDSLYMGETADVLIVTSEETPLTYLFR